MKKVKSYFRDIVLGVKACHDADIIHRDLKPDNIIWIHSDNDENGGRFVLIDFDISVSYSSFATWLDPTMASCVSFRAPEALFLSNTYNKKIDIWSLGNIFYLMVTGRYICEKCDSMEEIIISMITMFGLPDIENWPDVYDLPF